MSGDEAVVETADSIGKAMSEVAQALHDAGVDIDIKGIPRLVTRYYEDTGLKTSYGYESVDSGIPLMLTVQPENSIRAFRDVLAARDMHQKIRTAEKAATDPATGATNVERLKELLGKDGIAVNRDGSYSAGGVPVADRTIRGTGIIVGGGNVGGSRGHVTARAEDVAALPTRPLPRPAREVQEITRALDLGGNFHGLSSGLLAVALAGGGLVSKGADAQAGYVDPFEGYIRPGDMGGAAAAAPATLNATPFASLSGETAALLFHGLETPDWDDQEAVDGFLEEHWGVLTARYEAYRNGDDLTAFTASRDPELYGPASADDPPAAEAPLFVRFGRAREELSFDLPQGNGPDTPDASPPGESPPGAPPPGASPPGESPPGGSSPGNPPETGAGGGGPGAGSPGSARPAPRVVSREAVPEVEIAQPEVNRTGPGVQAPGPPAGGAPQPEKTEPIAEVTEPDPEITEPIAEATEPGPEVTDGPVFGMDEDTVFELTLDGLRAADDLFSGDASWRLVSVGGGDNGAAGLDNGVITFTPEADFFGRASFEYTLENGAGEQAVRRATMAVAGVNDAPEVHDDAFTLPEDTPFYLDRLLANDTDAENDPLVLERVEGLAHGALAYDAGGRLFFTPEREFAGALDFTYRVTDGMATPVSGRATLTYEAANDAPDIGADQFVLTEETPFALTADQLIANDSDIEGDAISFGSVGAALHGAVALSDAGGITFVPDADFYGAAGFSYTAVDAHGAASEG